ncbi:prevent-host-death protein [Xenorhabdus ishibashii]|uniref:Prevent-host-death protein n=1 Tax=Xenorhabdus ishibashii TaxID=1034471 RepID=A0A2D0KGQ2_9GAMM|nr:prevent-host-death protein [Xenorhabdus ishibashii]
MKKVGIYKMRIFNLLEHNIMAIQANMHETKTHLSQLTDKTVDGVQQ